MVSFLSPMAISLLILSATVGFIPQFAYAKGGFSIDLIHRDSPISPLSDSTATHFHRLKAAAERSFARAVYFRNSMQNTPSSSAPAPSPSDNLYSEVSPNSFEYLMNFYVGSPAKEVLAIADTGSDLIWIQCKPCNECAPQTPPLFDPQASSTYKDISCHAESCSALPKDSCGPESQCEYIYGYGDGSVVDGFLATETLSFDSTGGRRIPVPSTIFGCTHRSNGSFSEKGAGLVGLGGGRLSLIRQLGSAIDNRFSYCLPSLNKASATSRLNFGSSAVVSGPGSVTTPLIPGSPDTFYFLSLDQISVDGQGSVLVKPMMPAAGSGSKGNIIIDSGTTLTLIDNETLTAVAKKVASSVSLPQVADPDGVFSLCFNGTGAGDDVVLPDITFHFSGGAPVVLHPFNAFVAISTDTLCMALVSSDGAGVNIFGNIAQQNFHIGYDLGAMQLTLAPADCANL